MSNDDQDFRVRPGRGRDAGAGSGQRGKRLAAQVKRAAARSGFTRSRPGLARRGGTGRYGRGRHALAAMRRGPAQRRVTVMARIVRHKGAQFRSAPLGRHIAYLERDGVTRDGRDASMFDADGDAADRNAFAERCGDDRHHFRLIVSPEDAAELEDLRRFTRDLMKQMARDLDSSLDWVAVDHWNTDNPHIHMVANAEARWKDSVGAFEDAMKVQAGIVSNMGGTRTSIATIVGASQSATGALQAAQAGNQLLAIQSQQITDLAAVMSAQGRAEMLAAARAAAAEAEGRERFRRFRKGN